MALPARLPRPGHRPAQPAGLRYPRNERQMHCVEVTVVLQERLLAASCRALRLRMKLRDDKPSRALDIASGTVSQRGFSGQKDEAEGATLRAVAGELAGTDACVRPSKFRRRSEFHPAGQTHLPPIASDWGLRSTAITGVIENRVHWVRDVAMGEDRSCARVRCRVCWRPSPISRSRSAAEIQRRMGQLKMNPNGASPFRTDFLRAGLTLLSQHLAAVPEIAYLRRSIHPHACHRPMVTRQVMRG